MYKLEFTLKQHTPLIHFQHEQEGATLRATEVKPKLDRFLIGKLQLTEAVKKDSKNVIVPKKEFETWFNNKERLSLNYKLLIVDHDARSVENRAREITIIPPNIDISIYSNDLKLIVTSFNSHLKKKISENIEEFFILNSFGKRNNKGFGNYYIQYDDIQSDWINVKRKLAKGVFIKENIFRRNIEDVDFTFEYKKISDIHKLLKSGINLKDKTGNQKSYKKSKLFVYSINRNMRWEKRWMKKELIALINSGVLPEKLKATKEPNDWCNNLDIKTDNGLCSYNNWIDSAHFIDQYFFVRLFLGLSEHWEFLTLNKDLKYKVIPESNDVERFKSPLTFKVFGNNLYLLIGKIPDELFSQHFTFKVQMKRKTNNKWEDSGTAIYFQDNLHNSKNLFVPDSNSFDLHNFITESIKGIGFTLNN